MDREQEREVVVGIDLGTTCSLVAWIDATGRPSTLINAEGDHTTPSAVFFDRDEVVVGKEAEKIAEIEPTRVVRYAKRDMGRSSIQATIRGESLPPEVVQALILKKLKSDAAAVLGPVDRAVITVPAYFDEPRRKATADAGRLAGFEVLDILNEPTAAAIAYGYYKGFMSHDRDGRLRDVVLVYDLGGGTFDVTLMEMAGAELKALGTGGDVFLGGVDWTKRIVDHVSREFVETYGTDPRDDKSSLQAMLREAEDAKRALTSRHSVNFAFSHDGQRLRTAISRDQFEEMTRDLLDRTVLTTQNVLREAGRTWQDVTEVLLVGGASRMSAVERLLEEVSGLKPDRSLSPDEAVAHGAAIYAALLAGNQTARFRHIQVSNVSSHDLGVLGVETETGRDRRRLMIPRNTPLPCKSMSRFKTFRADQHSVSVNIIEGGDASGNNATPIGKCVVSGLPPRLPAGTPVEVTFRYRANGRLVVDAYLPSIDRVAELQLERTHGFCDETFQYWLGRIEQGFTDESVDLRNTTPSPERPTVPELTVGVLPIDALRNGVLKAAQSSESRGSSEPRISSRESRTTHPSSPVRQKPRTGNRSPRAVNNVDAERRADEGLSELGRSNEHDFGDETLDERSMIPRSVVEIVTADDTKRQLGPKPQGAWKVLTANTGLHLLLLLVLTWIVVPGPKAPDYILVNSRMTDQAVEPLMETVVMEQPTDVAELPSTKVQTDLILDSPDEFLINENDFAPSLPAAAQTGSTGPAPIAPVQGEAAGRSQAGKSALLVRYGGTEQSEAAVGAALNWLAQHQWQDGSWSFDHRCKNCDQSCDQFGSLAQERIGATAMALIAFMGSGNTYAEGDYQANIESALNFLLAHARRTPAGLDLRAGIDNQKGMYVQGLATICLSEALAMNQRLIHEMGDAKKVGKKSRRQLVSDTQSLQAATQQAIEFIVNAQNAQGGWKYLPGQAGGDTSVLGWQVMALESARAAGIQIPKRTMTGVTTFLDSVQSQSGAFYGYEESGSKASTTAIGLLCRMYSGWDRDNVSLQKGVKFLSTRGPEPDNMYHNYYATQVLHHWGGKEWEQWNDHMRDLIVKTQCKSGHAAGSWNVADQYGEAGGRLYMTCLATMTLEIYYRHLPLYDRESGTIATKSGATVVK